MREKSYTLTEAPFSPSFITRLYIKYSMSMWNLFACHMLFTSVFTLLCLSFSVMMRNRLWVKIQIVISGVAQVSHWGQRAQNLAVCVQSRPPGSEITNLTTELTFISSLRSREGLWEHGSFWMRNTREFTCTFLHDVKTKRDRSVLFVAWDILGIFDSFHNWKESEKGKKIGQKSDTRWGKCPYL